MKESEMKEKGLTEENYREFAQKVVQKYFDKGDIVDGLLWTKIVALYEAELEDLRVRVAAQRADSR